MKEDKKYFHIINNKITKMINQKHPYENDSSGKYGNKFIKKFASLLKAKHYEIFKNNKNKNKFYKIITNQDFEYFVYIKHCGIAGKEFEKNEIICRKKVPIPSAEYFKEKVRRQEKVLIVNVYYFLKSKTKVDEKKFVYIIRKPEAISDSDVLQEGNKHGSNSYVYLKDIKDFYNSKNEDLFKETRRKKSYIVHPHKILKFFNIVINKNFFTKDYYKKELINTLNELEKLAKYKKKFDEDLENQKIRNEFRQKLVENRGLKCEWINCEIKISELIFASHIKAQSVIKKEKKLGQKQKKLERLDINNGFLLCKRHDAMFDKHLFSFNDNGQVTLINKKIKSFIKPFCSLEDKNEKVIEIKKGMHYYLKQHREECLNKSKEM